MSTRDYDASYLDAVKKGYWKDFNDRYSVSMYGTVYDKERDRIVMPCLNNGYEVISVKDKGKWIVKGVHQLVLEAFNGKVPKGMQVNHINEDKTDNRLENLNLMTPKQNTNWGSRNERISKANTNNKLISKSVIQKTLDGKVIKIWPSANEVQRTLEYSKGNICNCCNGGYYRKGKWIKYTQAYGYIWQYEEANTN